MTYAKLIDTKKCIGCKACQVICKEWNGLEGELTQLPEEGLGLTNPPRLTSQRRSSTDKDRDLLRSGS
jgi:formate dehydrogenase iron-sulfur subunit